MKTVTLKIDGMNCDGCARRIERLLEKAPGVREVRVSFSDGQAQIRHNPHAANQHQLIEMIEGAGFSVSDDNHD